MEYMTSKCSRDDVDALNDCVDRFFCRRPLLQSTDPTQAPKQDKTKARRLKSPKELEQGWTQIMARRRLEEPNDRGPLQDDEEGSICARMWRTWEHEWIERECTVVQKQRKWARQTSLFLAWANNNLGGKHFIIALWQTGISWAPTPEMLVDQNGASEHIAWHFAHWCLTLCRALQAHKTHPDTQAAITRSGGSLLPMEHQVLREQRNTARQKYRLAERLHQRLLDSKGTGKGRRGQAKEAPLSWESMNEDEQCAIVELIHGRLRRVMNTLDARWRKLVGRVQAPRFSVSLE